MRFRCNVCYETTFPKDFTFEDRGGVCPQCGASGMPLVVPLVDIHLVVLDRKGPIVGKMGRQKIVCQPRRTYLATHMGEHFSATDNPSVVTCPRCKRLPEFQAQCVLWNVVIPVDEPTTLVVDLGKEGGS